MLYESSRWKTRAALPACPRAGERRVQLGDDVIEQREYTASRARRAAAAPVRRG